MDLETIFTVANTMVLPGWLLLIVAPWWRWSAQVVAPLVIPAVLAVMYAALMASAFASAEGGFGSLAGVRGLFEVDRLLLAGWIHYLAFDLFIGAWEVRDARRSGVSHLLVIPCLFLTFMAGPVGLALYFAIRAAVRRKGWIDDGIVDSATWTGTG